MPGAKTSAISPSLTNTAILSFAHRQLGAVLDLVAIALEAQTSASGLELVHSMTSTNSPKILSISAMAKTPQGLKAVDRDWETNVFRQLAVDPHIIIPAI
ncbi:MAG: hypothetical protein R3C97_07690 [Geminicoccaceae bacterium]